MSVFKHFQNPHTVNMTVLVLPPVLRQFELQKFALAEFTSRQVEIQNKMRSPLILCVGRSRGRGERGK